MKNFLKEFFRRGIVAAAFGPIVLAFIYLILKINGIIETLNVNEVIIGIFSLTFLAFIAGGLNSIHKFEKIPLMVSVLIHGAVLYVCYLITYVINGWLKLSVIPLLVFTAIFIIGYVIIWIIIYFIIRNKTDNINIKLKEKQKDIKKERP